MADIANSLRGWSATASSNQPTDSTTIGAGLDDNLRQIQAVVRQFLAFKGTAIASAATMDLSTMDGSYASVTGNTTVTGLGTEAAGIEYWLRFASTPMFKSGSSLLIGGSDLTFATGDIAKFISEGSGIWVLGAFYSGSGFLGTGAIVRSSTSFLGTGSIVLSSASFTTGDVKLTIKTVADSGWVLMDDGTIGNAASSATSRADADTSDLFTLLWTNTADADCAVSSGRGISAAADYAANKTIALPKSLGRALATYGSGSGLTARALAHVVGEETHALTLAENGAHTHGPGTLSFDYGSDSLAATSVVGDAPNDTDGIGGSTKTLTGGASASSGSGTGHNTMQPTVFLNVMIKL